MLSKVVITFALFAIAVSEKELSKQFKDFQQKYRKNYRTHGEYEKRFEIFKSNWALAQANVKSNSGSASFGVTQFSDLTPAEFKDLYLTNNIVKPDLLVKTKFDGEPNKLDCTPNSENFDWGSCGAVTNIKDQSRCNSGYAFAAVEEVESAYALKTGSLKSFSAQQVVDCNEASTCSGGDITSAIEYIQRSESLSADSNYPFTSTRGVAGSCKAKSSFRPDKVAGSVYQDQFNKFIEDYGRSYHDQAEYNHRLSIFESNIDKSAELTKLNGGSARFGVNKFSDMSEEEFRNFYLMPKSTFANYKPLGAKNFTQTTSKPKSGTSCNPDSTTYNWVNCGQIVGPVRNQEQCGACWAFSTVETVESYCVIGGAQFQPLSPQQLVDCDTSAQGCGGGFPSQAYGYIQQAGGVDTESSYPYTAEQGQCAYKQSDAVCSVSGYKTLSGESGLYQQLSSSSGGPVSVCVDASSWQNYQGGVMTSCGSQIDHCVQATGYNGYGSNGAYWIVRNQWGTSWGESGYIYIAIGQNLCAIGNAATVPEVSNNGGTTSSTGSTGSSTSSGTSLSSNSASSNSGSSNSASSNSGSSNSGSTKSSTQSGSTQSGSSNSASSNSGSSHTGSTAHTSTSTHHFSSSTSSSGNSQSGSSNSGSSGKSTSSSTGSTGSTGSTSTGATGTSTGPTGSTGQPTGSTGASTASTAQPTGSTGTTGDTSASTADTTASTGDTTGSSDNPTGSTTGSSDTTTSGDTTSGDSGSTGSYESDFQNSRAVDSVEIPQFSIKNTTTFELLNGETGMYMQLSSPSGGPVIVAVDATQWQFYNGGVITSCGEAKKGPKVNHYAQVVGYISYGTNQAFWIVRNSWGEMWGEDGHVYIAVGEDVCGIGEQPTVIV